MAATNQPDHTFVKRVLIVDDSAVVRRTLSQLFGELADFQVCGEAEDGAGAIEKAQQLHPDVIVIDLSMRGMSGLDACRAIRRMMPTVRLILFTLDSDRFVEQQAVGVGISAVISKTDGMTSLIDTARSLFEGPWYGSIRRTIASARVPTQELQK